MSLGIELGLLFALATAFTSVVGFLYKHRGAVESPDVRWREPIRSSLRLFRSRWYTLGIVIAMGAWLFHVAALSLAPISLVQAVIAGGLVLLTVVADKLFAHSVTQREWIGVALAAAGLTFLAATLEGTHGAHAHYDAATIAAYMGVCAVLGLGICALARETGHAGVLLGASAGLIWAASDIAIKADSGRLGDGAAAVLLNPLAVIVAVASFVGLLISARSLQIGKAVPVIAVTSVTANVFTIAAGPIVFGDPLPSDTLGVVARLAAFALVISAAALTPAPIRAAQAEPA